MKFNLTVSLFILFLPFHLLSASDHYNPDVIAEGGRLYDKWWTEYSLPKPQTTHPSYPESSKKTGANSWRCKECHGWDYKGANGVYGKGGHYTGIKGIRAITNKSIQQLVEILKNNTHRYNDVMLDYGLVRIATFIKYGQVDISSFVDKKTKRVNGNMSTGEDIYNETCKDCHGSDGRERNFKTKVKPEYIGTVATKNPWETIHKIRNGHPDAFVMGDPMPNMNAKLSLEKQIDLLTYLQSLPIK